MSLRGKNVAQGQECRSEARMSLRGKLKNSLEKGIFLAKGGNGFAPQNSLQLTKGKLTILAVFRGKVGATICFGSTCSCVALLAETVALLADLAPNPVLGARW